MPRDDEPRDLLAERIQRLEKQISELSDQVGSTAKNVERAGKQLDAIIGLVGRLSLVVDVQGDSLQGDDDQREQKIGRMERRVQDLSRGLRSIASRLDEPEPQASTARRRPPPSARIPKPPEEPEEG